MKRTRRKRNANNNSLQGRRGGEKAVGGTLSSENSESTAGEDIVDGSPRSPDVEKFGRKAGARGGSRTQSTKPKGIRNNPTPSAETLLSRQKFDEGLRRGLLQAATNNSPLPDWLLQRKSYDRAGEFYVRLKAELVAPEQRDPAKIKRMLAELHSSQQQDAKLHDEADDTMPGQDFGHAEGLDAEDGDGVPVEQSTEGMHQQLSGIDGHTQSLKSLDLLTMKYQDGLRRALLNAAENGTSLSGYIQVRSVAGLGDFWVRLKRELLSNKRDGHRIKRMLDEWRSLEQQGAEAADDESFSAGEAEQEELGAEEGEANSEQWRQPGKGKLKDRQAVDDDDRDDDIFVRRPRRRHRLLARQQVEEEL